MIGSIGSIGSQEFKQGDVERCDTIDVWETFARRVRIIKVWIWANVLYLGKFHPKIVDEGPNLALFLY